MRTVEHDVDVCVVGGGMAGMCAAIAAARRGARTLLMQDRPVLGGNASSEVRMWVCGAQGDNNRETGIVEEIELENLYGNTHANYSVWDSILYAKARFQNNLTLLLNCTCNDAVMDGERIASVKGWQLTSETWHTAKATLFADCSGDSILAPLSGAEFRYGREAQSEFNESIAPEHADELTMGMSCLIQARETDAPQPFTPPAWAHTYETDDGLPNRAHTLTPTQNFWWMEIGGEAHSIHATEENRDELLKIAYGVWDHIKNHGDHGAENWALDWMGFLPGKRESRRYVGDHILTQNDVRDGGPFDDVVAYGGWSMDDHHPAGFRHPGKPTIFHPAPSPYGIAYRCLYSKDIANLLFAGRNISATHAAMSSTRVMASCATLGQAAGTAAAIAVQHDTTPRGVHEAHIAQLQQALMEDDCYLPRQRRRVTDLVAEARLTASRGDPEPLRNGLDRPIGEDTNAWTATVGDWAEYEFTESRSIESLRLVFDSDLNRGTLNMPSSYPLDRQPYAPPPTLVKGYHVDALGADGTWSTLVTETNNYQRLVRLHTDVNTTAMKLTIDATWGSDPVNVFAWDLE